jgi:cytidine deaminase
MPYLQIDMQFSDLVHAASAVRDQAYVLHSNFAVGAAVQCKSGAVFVGSNIENISCGLTICAERVAIGSAVAAGEREFVAIAVIVDTTEPIVPCGAGRQFLAEFSFRSDYRSRDNAGRPEDRESFPSSSGSAARNS